MILTCPDCATSYFVDDERVPPQGRTVKCSSCGNRWKAMPDGAAEPEPEPASRPSAPAPLDSTVAEPALDDDLEFVAAPVTPRRKSAKPEKKKRPTGVIVGLVLAVLVAGGVGAAVVMREQVAGMVPGTAPIFAAAGLPVNTLGLVIEGVTSKAVLEGGRPALAITGAIRNVHHEATEAPPILIHLRDKAGAIVAFRLLEPTNARVPPGGVRYFAVSLPDPPANAHELEIAFDLGAGRTEGASHSTPAHAPAAPPPAEAKPLPEGSPDALEHHEQH